MSGRSRTPVIEEFARGTILKTTTASTGPNWVAVGNAGGGPVTCSAIDLDNTTGVELQLGFGVIGDTAPTGQTFELGALRGKDFRGLTDSRQLLVRRTDQSGTQVTFKAIAYA